MAHIFQSTKTLPLGSTAFRQPFAQSHCKYLHGYRLQAKFWFEADKLDENSWVVDFGSLKLLKGLLEKQFDHTTCISSLDPEKPLFEFLHSKNIIDLRVMDGVGIEKFAEYCFNIADVYIKDITKGRCWVSKVEVWEHEGNSAMYALDSKPVLTSVTTATILPPAVSITTAIEPVVKVEVPAPPANPAVAASTPLNCPPLHYPKSSNGYKDLFKGTSWGNK